VKEKLVTTVAVVLGALLFANAVSQLIVPEAWYGFVPGVSDRGPYNPHFVRDIGIIYAICGVGLVLGGLQPAHRLALWWVPAVWLGAHALFHLWEIAAGYAGIASLAEDFMGVTVPALLTIALLVYAVREKRHAGDA
jgi:hypothetical protein